MEKRLSGLNKDKTRSKMYSILFFLLLADQLKLSPWAWRQLESRLRRMEKLLLEMTIRHQSPTFMQLETYALEDFSSLLLLSWQAVFWLPDFSVREPG